MPIFQDNDVNKFSLNWEKLALLNSTHEPGIYIIYKGITSDSSIELDVNTKHFT